MNITRAIIQKYLPKTFWHGTQSVALQVLHDTGNYLKGDTALANYNFWVRQNNGIAAHTIVDKTQILETVPWNQKAWHVGGVGNTNSWGVELCNMTTQSDFDSQIDDTAKYFALFRFKYMNGIDVTKDNLKSHYECNQTMKTGSTHTDVNGYFAHYGFTMDKFRALVQKYLNELKAPAIPVTPVVDPILVADVDVLTKAGVIGSPEAWKTTSPNAYPTGNIYALMNNMVKYIIANNKDFILNVNILNDVNIISQPDYWINNATYDKNVEQILIHNMAEYIRKLNK